MNDLSSLIQSFTPQEQEQFVTYLSKKNKRLDSKNVKLFKFLACKTNVDTNICKLLYPNNNKPAYHALRKRLFASLIDFKANTSLKDETSKDIHIIKHIIAARSLLQDKQYNIGYSILSKAEILAKEQLAFTLLNEIYHTKIQYASTQKNIDLNNLIKIYNQNNTLYQTEEQLNIAYARIRFEMTTLLSSGEYIDFNLIVSKIFSEQNINIDDNLNLKSFYQLISIASVSAYLSKDYLNIEHFVTSIYNKIKDHPHKAQHLYYHIHVIYMMANMYFRNKKFGEASKYLNIMLDLMLKRNKKYYSVFLLKYENLLALNYCYTNNIDQAIELAKNYSQKKHQDIESQLDIRLCLCMYFFMTNSYSLALKEINSFYHSDNWYESKTGKEWVLKKNIIELLIHYELEHIDLVESRLKSFKRKYFSYLNDIPSYYNVKPFIKCIEQLYMSPEIATTAKFESAVKTALIFKSPQQEDIFIMTFYAWLKAKMIKANTYDVVLDLVDIK